MFFFSFAYSVFAQLETKIANNFGLSVAMNSIQAQVEIPLMTATGFITNAGAVAVDADGNILANGNRVDNSFSYSIVPKYYIHNDFLLRFEFGMTNLTLKANSDSKGPLDHIITNEDVTTKIFRCTPGFQWIFMKKKKIESYCGMTMSYVKYSDMNLNVYSEHREAVTDTIMYWIRKKENTPGGFAVGIGAFAGFNIYLNKHFSLGAELSSSALYYKLGGVTTGENSEQVFPNSVDTYPSSFTNSYKGFKISKIISSFNISFWF